MSRENDSAASSDRFFVDGQWRFRCWCCGHPTLEEGGGSTYEICSRCGWEDDHVQNRDPSYRGGANSGSLLDYRRDLLEHASDWNHHPGNSHKLPRFIVKTADGELETLDAGVEWLTQRIASGSAPLVASRADGPFVVLFLYDSLPGQPPPPAPPGFEAG